MTLIYKNVPQDPRSLVVGFHCNCCKRSFNDDMALQEMFYKHDVGGYGSAFGDMSEYEIVLCTNCAFKLLAAYTDWIVDTGDVDEPED